MTASDSGEPNRGRQRQGPLLSASVARWPGALMWKRVAARAGWVLVGLMLLALGPPTIPVAHANGTPNLIGAHVETLGEITNATAFKYKFRVNSNSSQNIKIIFNGLAFYNPNTGQGWNYFLETNLYNAWIAYQDNQYNCLWPPRGIPHPAETGFWVSLSDYWKSGRVGVRQDPGPTQAFFPRQNSGIDAISGLTKIETISQMDMTGKDVEVQISRGEVVSVPGPLEGWGFRWLPVLNSPSVHVCTSSLPSGEYRKWWVRALIDGSWYVWEMLLPESHARYIHPFRKELFTEFFDDAGFFQAYFWDIALQREGSSTWKPITRWETGTSYCSVDKKTNGFKLARYNKRWVIEVSNDGTNTYRKLGDVFEFPPRNTISASPSPCSIAAGERICTTTITWTSNRTNACIFLRETGQKFACGQSGSAIAPWISDGWITFDLRADTAISSRLLAAVRVEGLPADGTLLTLDSQGPGDVASWPRGIRSGTACSHTYRRGSTVWVTATPHDGSVFGGFGPGECVSTMEYGGSWWCEVLMNANKIVHALFTPIPSSFLTSSVTPTKTNSPGSP